MNSLISVIVPIYNTEAYLWECVSSVLNQSYRELEIILVDDGSTDRSGIMCDEFGKRDSRVMVVHKENGGLSDARNTGISKAGGKYLYFLDSDDVLAEDALSILVSLCEESHAEIALTGLKHFSGHVPRKRRESPEIEVMSGEETVIRMLKHEDFCHEAQGKLYLRTFWGEFCFPSGCLYEDYATIYDVAVRAENVVYYKTPKYYHRVRENSITRSCISKEDFVLLDISDGVTERIISWNPALEKYAVSMQAATYLKVMKRILDTGFNSYPWEQKRVLAFIRDKRAFLLACDEMRKMDKIKVITLLLHKRIFYLAYRLGDLKNAIRMRWGI